MTRIPDDGDEITGYFPSLRTRTVLNEVDIHTGVKISLIRPLSKRPCVLCLN